MSTTVTYKGSTLATVSNNTKVLSTEGKYLEDDITLVDVTQGGSATLGEKSISSNGTYNASSDNLDGYSKVVVTVPTGPAKTSSDLTASNLTVTAPAGLYASDASKTLSDANLVAGNIKKDVTIFSVTGTYEGGGGGNFESGTFTPASDTKNFTATVSFEPSGFQCSVAVSSITGTDNTWKTYGFSYLNSTDGGFDFLRYGATNNSAQRRDSSQWGYSNGTFTHTTYGNMLSGLTYAWVAW